MNMVTHNYKGIDLYPVILGEKFKAVYNDTLVFFFF